MFRALFRIVLMLSLVTASGAWAAVSTQDRIKPEHGMEQTVLAAADVSLKHAAAMAKKSHGGKVVKAETKNRGGRKVHHIRLVNEGRVKTIVIDAATGREVSP
ncbi:PepSY domain-containing protein [Amphritea balenae]|uniref:PepSY domain-containing protein n=1 Tax=Amphritea balenae TaxID=452629 RepID=A0A3P1SPD9_9GAMM|nr:PepSY domain-containing protein [Amphritea balenae]RRC99006.1 hypothetical protein EHS89_12630 [Amphritea balenae]